MVSFIEGWAPRICSALVLMLGSATADAQLLCNKGRNCGPCDSFQQAYAWSGLFCVACSGVCKWYSPQPDGAEAKSDETPEFLPMEGGVYRPIQIAYSQLQAIAQVNPWAASALMTLGALPASIDLSHGSAKLAALPTAATFALAAGPWTADQVQATSVPFGIDVDARVGWTMMRKASQDAEFRVSAFVADGDGRVLYNVYPDVILRFADPPGLAPAGDRDKIGASRPLPLTLTSWSPAF